MRPLATVFIVQRQFLLSEFMWCVLSALHSATGLIGCRGEHSITLDLVSDAIALKLAFVG